jgi:hypothetical protein
MLNDTNCEPLAEGFEEEGDEEGGECVTLQ